MNSQIEHTQYVLQLLKEWSIQKIEDSSDLVNLQEKMLLHIKQIPVTEENEAHEREIRWKRTGAQVLQDGYVYKGKACTDLIVAFLTLCKALNIPTQFVKLKSISAEKIHSICEVSVNNEWYNFNASIPNQSPQLGAITNDSVWGNPPNGPYKLWAKGSDSWSIGLAQFDDKLKMEKDVLK